MKVFIFALLLAGATLAKEFKVQSGGKTCALLTLKGQLDLVADKDGKEAGKTNLNFDDATVEASSSCDTIKLNMSNSVEVWFKFAKDNDNWKVTPIAAFIPVKAFGTDVNETDAVTLTATPLAPFPAASSYLCKSSTSFTFTPETVPKDFNYTVSAAVTGFQIQSVESETFKKGSECAADTKEKDYVCKDGNKTMIVMDGSFSLDITYNMTNEQGKVVKTTRTITVPGPQDSRTEGKCEAKAEKQTLSIKFFDDWGINFEFAKDKDYYSVSNISVEYHFDKNLPNATATGSEKVVMPVAKNYLKASTKGYYICNANLEQSGNNVVLKSKDFKYRAFDDESKGFNGDVSECPGDEDSNSIVPIAVGAALAGLVVIVLVAYLIGRKRSRKTGYESV